jgi:ribonuclease HI
MSESPSQYLLLTETYPEPGENVGGQWRFVLQPTPAGNRLEVSDFEEGISSERLQLLAVVRGLEAIDGRAQVTLVTSSRYVSRGVRFGLELWRENDWQWERFGEMLPIKNLDLWQRVDRALQFHTIECRVWRLQTVPTPAEPAVERPTRAAVSERPTNGWQQLWSWSSQWMRNKSVWGSAVRSRHLAAQ